MDSWPFQLFVQILLIFINAFFAASEIALISLNKIKLKKEFEEGNKKSGRLLKLAEEPDNFLSTIQIGITLAGFLGSAFAAENFAERLVNVMYYNWGWQALPFSVLDTICVIIITIVLSYFTLVLGELVPKRIAMKKPEKVARFTCNVVYYISKVMRPVIWFLSKSCNLVLRIFGIKPETEEEKVTEEEIQMMVDTAEEMGEIEEKEQEWISNVFEFNDINITKIMTPAQDVVYVTEDMTFSQIKEIYRKYHYTRLLYCKNGLNDIIGIINIKDFFTKDYDNIEEIVRKPYYVSEFMLADDLFHSLQKTHNHLAVVVDEFGNTIGIITVQDLLEEIVGDMYDEDDSKEDEDIRKIDDKHYEVNGSTSINDFMEYFNVKIDDDSFDTVAGLICSKIDYFPNEDTDLIIEAYNLKLTVLEINKKRIKKVLVEIL